MSKLDAFRFAQGAWERIEKEPPREGSLTIYLNGEELATLSLTPDDERALVVGFLFTEGIVDEVADVARLDVDSSGNAWVETRAPVNSGEARRKILTSGCGKGVSFKGNLKGLSRVAARTPLEPESITAFVRECQEASRLYRASGGIHTAALLTTTGEIFLREDIGRHNALDKAIGSYLLQPAGDPLAVFATGRLSSEMVSKAVRVRAQYAVSLSSPTDLAVILGERFGVTVVGYARGGTFIVYSHPERVVARRGRSE